MSRREGSATNFTPSSSTNITATTTAASAASTATQSSQLQAAGSQQAIRFKFKEPKLRETTLDKSVRCMTLGMKKQHMLKDFLVDEIQSIEVCVEKILEIKRHLKVERQEFFRRPLTQARIKEKRRIDEHYDDFIKEYDEKDNQLRDFELVFFNQKKQSTDTNKSLTVTSSGGSATIAGTHPADQTIQSSTTQQPSDKPTAVSSAQSADKKREKKNNLMHGKSQHKDPVFRLYQKQASFEDEDGNAIEEEIEAPSFKYKYLTKDQLAQLKLENQPKKHNIPEKYCKCCNQLVRRHYCPHDFCLKPCLRHEKEKRLRQQYLDKNGGVRKQKKPLYRASIFANDIQLARSALDDSMTVEQQQEAERLHQQRIQAHLAYMRENELKIHQLKMLRGDEFLPKKKGRKPKPKNPDGSVMTPEQIAVQLLTLQQAALLNVNNQLTSKQPVIAIHNEQLQQLHQLQQLQQQQFVQAQQKPQLPQMNSDFPIDLFDPNLLSSIGLTPQSISPIVSASLTAVQNQKDKSGLSQIEAIPSRKEQGKKNDDKKEKEHGKASKQSQQQMQSAPHLLKQSDESSQINAGVGGNKVAFKNEDSSYESSSSGISSDSSSEEDAIKMDEED